MIKKPCFLHNEVESVKECKYCNKSICADCILKTPAGEFCSQECINQYNLINGKEDTYNATNIKVLEGIEAIRKRPAMFIGDTDISGLHHLVYELVDNSVDEALGGYCQNISVKIHANNSISVIDDGRGIPVDIHKDQGRPALEVIMTTLHSGGKFDRSTYKISGGLHGVGLSVVNSLSERLEVEIYRDEIIYFQTYECGKPTTSLQKLGRTHKRGTKIWFKPDSSIFSIPINFSYEILSKRMRELSFLTKSLRLSIYDERDGKGETFFNEEGIEAFIRFLNQNRNVLHEEIIYFNRDINIEENKRINVEVTLQYHDGYNEIIYSYANNIYTKEGGTHLSGFKAGLTRSLNGYAKKENLIKGKLVPSGEDFREGLTAVVSIKLPEPQFEGQTKGRLGNREIQSAVETVVNEQISIYFEEHPQIAREIVSKGLHAAQTREAARKARDLERQRKSPLNSGNLPGKLADCTTRELESTELYIVEGDSAGGSAKSGRDRKFQAILPLRGKILNVEKARIDKILSHSEIKMIISAIGSGVNNDFDIERRRYGKIIIMTDADVDGSHIRTLLLTFFFRQMRSLVEKGYIYIAQPPLYKFTRKKKEQYIYSDNEFNNTLLNFGTDGTKLKSADGRIFLENEKLRDVLQLLVKMEDQIRLLQRKGIEFESLLKEKEVSTGKLPICLVRLQNGLTKYFYSDIELNEFLKQERTSHGEEIQILTDDETETDNPLAMPKLKVVEIHESKDIEKVIHGLEDIGFLIEDYLHNNEVKFCIYDEKEKYNVSSLKELVKQIQDIGRKGLDIQRYKGLGEMNPEQLWETTMNPDSRTLFKVRMEDAIEADRMFTILMGSEVEPRKDFIEKHALEVKNLDI